MQICRYSLQHSETFDVSHVFLSLTIAEVNTTKPIHHSAARTVVLTLL